VNDTEVGHGALSQFYEIQNAFTLRWGAFPSRDYFRPCEVRGGFRGDQLCLPSYGGVMQLKGFPWKFAPGLLAATAASGKQRIQGDCSIRGCF
jgi:hypothetical protein